MITVPTLHQITSPVHPYEDRHRILGASHPQARLSGRGHVYAVMDGVGGAPMGMQAAQLIADRLADFYRAETSAGEEGMLDLLAALNTEIHEWGLIEGSDRPLGAAAATVAWFAPHRRLEIFHVGDTCAMRFDGERLIPLTRDHGSGRALARYVGQGLGFYVDRTTVELAEGEMILLLTDGVTKTLRLHDIQSVLDELPDAERAAPELTRRARSRGSRDDITALLVQLEEW
jgi:serine/threonine protein phosphatase PrpC